VPVTYADNRAFVSVRLNGHSLRFLVDTGGYDTVDASVARRLGLAVKAAGSIGGAGNGKAKLGTTIVKSLELGSRTLSDQHLLVVDFSPIARHLGLAPFDGMIGYDFFKNDVVTFLNSQSRMLIDDNPIDGTTVAFSLYGTIPRIRAWVNDLLGAFVLDTGDRSNVTLVATFPLAHPTIKNAVARSRVVTGWGVGGPILSDIVRLRSVRVSDLTVNHVVGRIALSTRGTFAATDIDGTLGNGYLRHFDVSIDYPHRQLVLRRNRAWTRQSCAETPAPPVILPQECLIARQGLPSATNR
jgi:Aspartyl protease